MGRGLRRTAAADQIVNEADYFGMQDGGAVSRKTFRALPPTAAALHLP